MWERVHTPQTQKGSNEAGLGTATKTSGANISVTCGPVGFLNLIGQEDFQVKEGVSSVRTFGKA